MPSIRIMRVALCSVLVWASLAAQAFMPVSGVWVIDSETNGSPGRGFQLDVENEIAIFYYNGYRPDGTSVFYISSGPIKNNVFTAALKEYRGGTSLGSAYKPATEAGSPGNVTITFRGGFKGTMQLPGESPKAITKFSFGYPPNPDGLLGTFLFAYTASTELFGDSYALTKKLGQSTIYGNGLVTDNTGTFICENLTAAQYAGMIACTEATNSQYDDYYMFRMVGDRGTGVGTWDASAYEYPLHVLRTATKTGETTGLNEGTYSSMEKLKHADGPAAADTPVKPNFDARKNLAPAGPFTPLLSSDEKALLADWAAQAGAAVRGAR